VLVSSPLWPPILLGAAIRELLLGILKLYAIEKRTTEARVYKIYALSAVRRNVRADLRGFGLSAAQATRSVRLVA
jgi:hypothetical protein